MIKKMIYLFIVMTVIFGVMSYTFADESYYIQVGAFSKEVNANSKMNVLKNAGYEVVIIKVHNYYKVFLGPYATEKEARLHQEKYTAEGGKGFLVLGSKMYDVVQPKPSNDTTKVDDVSKTDVDSNSTETQSDPEESKDETTTEVKDNGEETTGSDETAPDTTEVTDETVPIIGSEKEDAQEELNVDPSELMNDLIQEEKKDNEQKHEDYKKFTIILIMVLWLLFLFIVIIFRLNQNKKIL